MATDDPIRASDSDREVVVAALRDAFTTGRLTMEEFDERTSAAYQAKTWGELRQLTVDLPAQPILGADVPGRRWSPDEPPAQFPSPQLPSQPPRNNLPPRPPARRRRPVVMLVPLAVWLLLIAHTSGNTLGPIVTVVSIMLLVALLQARRRR